MQNPTPQEILAGDQSGDNAGGQPCYSPSGTTVSWIGQDGMPCTYQPAMLAPTGYRVQCTRPNPTTIIRQGNTTIGPIRVYPALQTSYQQPMAPTPPSQMPPSPTTIYSPPPPQPTNLLPSQQGNSYQHHQQQTYQPYVQAAPQGSCHTPQLQQNQRSSYQPSSNNQNFIPLPIYLTSYNSGPQGVRTQSAQNVQSRQQYLITTPTNLAQPTPPPSVRSTSRSAPSQQRTYSRRNVNSNLSALLTAPCSNLNPDDQSRNTKSIPYTPRHPNHAEASARQVAPPPDPPAISRSPSCTVANMCNNHQAPPNLPTTHTISEAPNSFPTGNECGECRDITPATSATCNVSIPQSSQTQPSPAQSQVVSSVVTVSRPPPSTMSHGRSQNLPTQATPNNRTPASVSSTTRIPTVPNSSTASIQVKPETANKACQFVSDKKASQDESISAIVDTMEIGCQTEDQEPLSQPVKKTYVDRACSPVVFPIFRPNVAIRRKTTAKRKPIQRPSPSPPPLVAANDQSSSDSDIDIIE